MLCILVSKVTLSWDKCVLYCFIKSDSLKVSIRPLMLRGFLLWLQLLHRRLYHQVFFVHLKDILPDVCLIQFRINCFNMLYDTQQLEQSCHHLRVLHTKRNPLKNLHIFIPSDQVWKNVPDLGLSQRLMIHYKKTCRLVVFGRLASDVKLQKRQENQHQELRYW